MRQRDAHEAERLLGRILETIHRGDLFVDGPAATAVAHRLEGALLALRASRPSSTRSVEGLRRAEDMGA